MKLQPGTEVTPNVRLERPLAKGAMGSVWVAEHLTLNTQVAVKFISDKMDPDDPEVFERFVREASAAAQIKSSHVVQTFDQGVTRAGTPYIVMELLEGEGLGDRVAREGRLSLDEVVTIVSQTAKALASAHKCGIVHRDIKPDNIFLATHDDELHVKVFDFGIAKHRGIALDPKSTDSVGATPELGLTNAGTLVGTPEYASPEQLVNASKVDHQADLWGLAVAAYVSLTGVLPFLGDDVGELCVNVLSSRFKPPSELRSDLGPETDAFFARAFARAPAQRFHSAREMAAAFRDSIPLAHGGMSDISLPGVPAPPLPRTSQPSLGNEDEVRGIRGATFSGSAADLMTTRRWSPSSIGAIVVLLAAVVAGIIFFTRDGGESDGGDVSPAAQTDATPPGPPPAPKSDDSAVEDVVKEGEPAVAGPGPTASGHDSTSTPVAPATVAPVFRPLPRPADRPKEPGF